MKLEKENEISSIELQRYMTQINLCEIGIVGQSKLKSASVIVIGAGGLGCAALSYLAAAGVGRIGIIDFDHIELGNLQRQILYRHEDVGKLKCEVAKYRLSQNNPFTALYSHAIRLSSENAMAIIENCDIVVDATDNFSARYAINDACLCLKKPFVYGSVHHFEGQLAVFNALNDEGKRGPDYRSLYPIPPTSNFTQTCADDGVIGALPGIIGSMQALEVIKLILEIGDILSGKLFKMNALSWRSHLYKIGSANLETDQSIEISPRELKKMHIDGTKVLLVDIREDIQRERTNIEGLWIPFSKLMDQCEHIPKEGQLVVLCCQKGIRSIQAARDLRKQLDIKNIYSLKGGWQALDVDL